jgi:hypothetical protein
MRRQPALAEAQQRIEPLHGTPPFTDPSVRSRP